MPGTLRDTGHKALCPVSDSALVATEDDEDSATESEERTVLTAVV